MIYNKMRVVFLVSLVVLCVSAKPKHRRDVNLTLREVEENTGSSRIIGGTNADIRDFPWQASLRRSDSHSCGAAILNARWVVTAAHCTQNSIGVYQINAGVSSRTTNGQLRSIKTRINHPNYNPNTLQNDISLLEMESDFDMTTDSVKEISFSGSTDDYPSVGEYCTITGWGRTSSNHNNLPSTLQKAELQLISNNDCIKKIGYTVSSGMICVHTDDIKSACNGDSGGPMTCTSKTGEDILAGVTSWGLQNCPENYPSVYTRISYYANWINSNIN